MTQKIIIEPHESLNPGVIGCIHKKMAIGKKMLIAEGWRQCKNPNFMTKGGLYANYNSIMKMWLVSK